MHQIRIFLDNFQRRIFEHVRLGQRGDYTPHVVWERCGFIQDELGKLYQKEEAEEELLSSLADPEWNETDSKRI